MRHLFLYPSFLLLLKIKSFRVCYAYAYYVSIDNAIKILFIRKDRVSSTESVRIMDYNKARRRFIFLVILLMVFQIYPEPKVTIAEEVTEHTYIIFEDDFKDGESEDWLLSIPPNAQSGSSWAVELDEGNEVLRGKGQTWAEVGDHSWTNYTYEVKVKLLTDAGGAISIRMNGPAGRYMLGFHAYGLHLVKEQPSNVFHDLKDVEVIISLNKWYIFRISCVGNTIEVYLDDVLRIKYVDQENPILSGSIGLESAPNSNVHFDDVVVYTTYSLYVANLLRWAQDEINKAGMVNADVAEAVQRFATAQAAFSDGNLSLTESIALETINMAKHSSVGSVSSAVLLKYAAEYDQHTVEVSGTIRDIRYEQGVYSFAIDDGAGVISTIHNGTLGEIKTEDKVKVTGDFDALTKNINADSVVKIGATTEGLYTFLIFKDDFEDGDFSDWSKSVDPNIEGSIWKVVKEDDNYILSGEGHCWSTTGDPGWTDYVFEFKMKPIKGYVHINFRITQTQAGTERYLIRLDTSRPSLSKEEAYLKEERITELKFLNVDIKPGNWYTVKIVCLGNNIKIYLDNNLVLDYTDEDTPYLSGLIGFEPVPYDGTKPSQILFDDVKVSKIATTSDINDLITYAQSEIDKAKEINADASAAELKLEQAKRVLAQEDYQMVQYMIDETVWLAKRSNLGEVSIRDLEAQATKCSGHVVVVEGTVRTLQASLGVGYDFNIDDKTGVLSVSFQGSFADIGEDYKVKVTGIFDASTETVSASRIEKISGPVGMTWSFEMIGTLITVCGAIAGVGGWIIRSRSTRRKKKILFNRLIGDVDEVYTRFKMNARRCEAELLKFKGQILDEFKQGMIDEEKYNVLEKRVNSYIEEIKDQIEREGGIKET